MTNGTSKIVRPDFNVPITMAYRDAEPSEGKYGDQMKYTLTDGRYIYLDLPVASKIDALGIRAGQAFTLCKRKDGRSLSWQITPGAGAGTPAAPVQQSTPNTTRNGVVGGYVQSTNSGHGELPVPAPPARPQPPAPGPAIHQGNFQYLIEQTQGLIDAYGALLAYSEQHHGNRIKPDDVRALLTTMFIQVRSAR